MGNLESKVEEIISDNLDEHLEVLNKVSGGASHYTYSVVLGNGDEYIFKASDYDWSGLPDYEYGFSIEGPMLEFLSDKQILTPEVLFFDNSEEEFDFKFVICEKVSGDNFFEAWESGDLSTVKEAGKMLARFHNSVSFSDSGKLGWRDGGKDLFVAEEIEWIDMVQDMIYTFSENMREQTEFSNYFEEIRDLFERHKEVLRQDFSPVLLHQEFGPRNMLVKNGEITGVVDWERAISGDPEFDVFIAERQFTARTNLFEGTDQEAEEIYKTLRDGYREIRDLEEGWEERRKIYHLVYITQVMWVLDDVVDSEDLLREYNSIRKEIEELGPN